ncbi:MAG: proline reductase cluster protein PrdD [Clostridiales bacterium]|nr:proline reductase cluster protein PrdD [Clostridiales bacterium]
MAAQDIELRRLVIKAFHMTDVKMGDENKITTSGTMTISKEGLSELAGKYSEVIEKIDLQVIAPEDHDRFTNTIMDIIPISVKVLGKCGEGITHTVTGVYVMPTGVDTEGIQAHEFGSSEGKLKDMLYLNRAGTPSDDDYIISFDITFKKGMCQERHAIIDAYRMVEEWMNIFRAQLKKFEGTKCTERHEYYDKIRPGQRKVLVIKEMIAHGAMLDTWIFPDQPSGVEGGKSLIDYGCTPIMLTPNEFRDGAIKAMN